MSEDRRLEHEPLCVRNRLTYPNAEPVTGERVKLTMVVYEGWRTEPSEGRVVGTSYAWTDADGIWTTRLLPYTAFEPDLQDSVYVQVYEQGQYVGDARIPPPRWPGDTRWLRELLPDQPPAGGGRWRPVSQLHDLSDVARTPPVEGDVLVYRDGQWQPEPAPAAATELGSLTDVDGDTVDDAHDGSVLIKRGGVWTAVPLALPALVDVDNASVAAAEPGDKLEYLGSEKGWGVAEEPSPGPDALEGSFSDPGAETSGDGMTTRITLTARDPSLNVLVDWGDGTGETALPPGQNSVDHTYAWEDSYSVWAHYEGHNDGGISDLVEIPYPRSVKEHPR